jgi:hypothetical protein
MWGKKELKPLLSGQGHFFEKTSLYKLIGTKKTIVRTAKAGESLQVQFFPVSS